MGGENPMTTVEKIRQAKVYPAWAMRGWLLGAVLWFMTLLIYVAIDKAGMAALSAVCSSMFFTCSFIMWQQRVNKELLQEIDGLKDQLRQNQVANL